MNRAQVYWASCTRCGDSESLQDEFKHSRVPTKEETKTTMTLMSDIEGVYLQTTKSGFRVRGCEDWKTYCNQVTRLKNNKGGFSRKIKSNDHVHLVGITYDASKANKVVSHCIAENAVILDSKNK